ncbi:hypothetical protein K438DRAFT_1954658 [Mycena galopus ATCC 62051]|nr:hypothetical protein K438DRAFT_1954658 [Mycena galopus ATCC 62051]
MEKVSPLLLFKMMLFAGRYPHGFTALVDPSPIASSLAAQYNVPCFPDIDSLFASQITPEAAIICTPNHTHVPLALPLAEAGIHLFVEKPISTSVASGLELIRAARQHKVHLLVGHHRRFNLYMIATKSAVDSGLLGDLTAVSALWTTFKPDPYFFASPDLAWRRRKEGGGVVLINLIHEADLLQHLFGPIVRVHAEKTISRRRVSTETGDDAAEEGAVFTMRFASGLVGSFVLSDAVVSPHNFEAGTGENPHIARARRAGGEEIDVYRILGTTGTLSVPDMTLWKYANDGDARSWENELIPKKLEIDSDPRVPFERQLDHFVNVVRGVEKPSCTGEEGLRALAVCDAIRRALDGEGGGTSEMKVPDCIGTDLDDPEWTSTWSWGSERYAARS